MHFDHPLIQFKALDNTQHPLNSELEHSKTVSVTVKPILIHVSVKTVSQDFCPITNNNKIVPVEETESEFCALGLILPMLTFLFKAWTDFLSPWLFFTA